MPPDVSISYMITTEFSKKHPFFIPTNENDVVAKRLRPLEDYKFYSSMGYVMAEASQLRCRFPTSK
jgi:hypothetical protein